MKNSRNIFILAIYFGPPGTMGGNMKIILEIINQLSNEYTFTIFTTEPKTFEINLTNPKLVNLVSVPYPYSKMSFMTHFNEVKYVYSYLDQYFTKRPLQKDDVFYGATDFGPDLIPLYWLRTKYQFKWVQSYFLFVPSPWENVYRKYGFPFIKYIIYYLYQKYTFYLVQRKADGCVITNHSDIPRFPNKLTEKVLPIYGGVNLDQIQKANRGLPQSSTIYEAVFCSRLHPQKGISQLLEIWKKVISVIPTAKLAIIGVGEAEYELLLRNKADELSISKNIEWLGYVNNVEKYQVYLKSKMLLHSTVYDNNGMVAAEALCAGLPVVLYDLPEFKWLYNEGCVKVKPADVDLYAQTVIKLIQNQQYYNGIKPSFTQVAEFGQKWNWNTRAYLFKKFIEDKI